jgi:hypothetical protein
VKNRTLILTITSSLVAFIIYYRGLAPSVATIFDDSLEFPLVVHRLAIAHPTGYPLYILLGKLFSLFKPDNIAYQLNLMSAVFAALTVGLLYRVGLALAAKDKPNLAHHAGAALGAILFGVGPVFYSQATIAEVYTLSACFVAGVLLATLRRQWLWLAFLVGLGLTHHSTMALLLPAVGIFIAVTYHLHRRQGWQRFWEDVTLPKMALAFAAPLALYLYLPLRGEVGSLDGAYQNTLPGFWQHITGGGYGVFLFDNPFGHERSARFYLSLLTNELGWWGLGLAVVGVGWLAWRRQWPPLLLTGVAFGTYLAFNLFYTVSDIEVFFIPVFLLLALWAGRGMGVLLDRAAQKQAIAALIISLLALAFILFQQKGQSRAADWAVHDYGLDVLAQPAPNSAVVGILGEMTLLRYFQETANLRPDVQTYAADLEADRLARLTDLLTNAPNRPVYLTRELAGLPEKWSLSAVGPLIRANPASVTAPPPVEHTINAPLTPAISLTGYSISRPPSHQAVPPVRLTLVWQVHQPVTASLKVSARLLDQAGEVAAVVDKVPVHFAYPTIFWRPGEFINDVYDWQLSPGAPPGNYTPLIILYDPANSAAEVGRVTLPPLAISQ